MHIREWRGKSVMEMLKDIFIRERMAKLQDLSIDFIVNPLFKYWGGMLNVNFISRKEEYH